MRAWSRARRLRTCLTNRTAVHGMLTYTFRYISDVGAQGLKPLFITGCVITSVFFDLGFLSERWLRHRRRLLQNKGKLDKWLSVLAIIFSIFGAVGLILLSIFDTLRHPHQHNGFLVLFM